MLLGPWLPKLFFGLGLVPRLCILVVVELLCHLRSMLGNCFPKLWFGLGLVSVIGSSVGACGWELGSPSCCFLGVGLGFVFGS